MGGELFAVVVLPIARVDAGRGGTVWFFTFTLLFLERFFCLLAAMSDGVTSTTGNGFLLDGTMERGITVCAFLSDSE